MKQAPTHGDIQRAYRKAVDEALENYRQASEDEKFALKETLRLEHTYGMAKNKWEEAKRARVSARVKMDNLLEAQQIPKAIIDELWVGVNK